MTQTKAALTDGTRKLTLSFLPSSINEEARTVEIVWATETPVKRNGWDGPFFEVLSMDPKHVRMERFTSGRAPYLVSHNSYDPAAHVGVLENARIENGQGLATVRVMKDDPEADKEWNKIRQGIRKSISVGYRIHKSLRIEGGTDKIPTVRAIDWEPLEASGVAIPADNASHIRSERNPMDPENQQNSNASPDVLRERERAKAINMAVRAAKLGDEFAQRLIDEGTDINAARAAIVDEFARRSEAHGGPAPGPSGAVERAQYGSHEAADTRVRNMADALASRAGCQAKLTPDAAQYQRLGMVDLARLCLEARGISPRLMSSAQIVARALHGTGDFVALLGAAGNRVLLDGYSALANAPTNIKRISRMSNANDFRPKSFLRLGEAPELLKVGEHSEYKHGTMASTSTGYSLDTFGRIFGLTRQAIINDDLGAFDMVRKYGRAAAELEQAQIVGLLTGNKLMDGSTLFSAGNGNLAASGSVLSIASLGEAMRAMRVQKGLDGNTPLNVTPRFLVVPAALEVLALQLTAEINAQQASNVNPFSGRLEVLVDARLDLVSPTAWYVCASPDEAPTIEHSYLDGATGPEVIEHEGFNVDGTQFKARMDWGCGVISPHGLYRNPGA